MLKNIRLLKTTLFVLTLSWANVGGQKCNSAGVYCIDSAHFQLCPEDEPYSDIPIGVPTLCPAGLTCDQGCSTECTPTTELPCPACNEHNFYCPTSTSFQQCTGNDLVPDPAVENCQNGNSCDMYCKYECLQKTSCLTCTEPKKYPSFGKPDHYFICNPGQPVMEYACNPGTLFNDALQRCIKSTVSTPTTSSTTISATTEPLTTASIPTTTPTTPTTTTSTTTTPTTTTSTTTTPTTTSATTSTTTAPTTAAPIVVSCASCTAATCVYANPNKCTQYIACVRDAVTYNYAQTIYTCSNNRYYDPSSNKCSTDPAVCSNVRPLHFARKLPVNDEFVCPDSGKFEDPKCCRDYYFCAEVDHLLEAFAYSCPGKSVFNADTKRCSFLVPLDCLDRGC